MENLTPSHSNASAVIDALYKSGSDRPNVRDRGRPEWFFDLSARVSVLIGDATILFCTHSFDGSAEQDGQAWLFTSDVVVIATMRGSDNTYELTVEAVGRSSLTGLVVERVSDPFSNRAIWPDDLSVQVEYGANRRASLPLGRYSNQLPELALLLPELAKDLNRPRTPSAA